MLVENNQQLHHTFFGLYIYQNNNLTQKDFWKEFYYTSLEPYIDPRQTLRQYSIINSSVTHLLTVTSIWDKF